MTAKLDDDFELAVETLDLIDELDLLVDINELEELDGWARSELM